MSRDDDVTLPRRQPYAGPLREVERLCGEVADQLRELAGLLGAHRETIAAGAWHAADRSYLSEDEAVELARALARIAECEAEIEEHFADPYARHQLGERLTDEPRGRPPPT